MKRAFVWLLVFLPFLVLLVPESASAAMWDPIIDGRCTCPESAPDWGCVLQTVQNTVNLGISLGVVIATLIIAYAGAVWLISPVNPESREMGRTMLMNAVIGLVIMLVGWLFVDFLMKQIYNPDASAEGVARLGFWNEILATDSNEDTYCIARRPEFGENPAPTTGGVTGGGEPSSEEEATGEPVPQGQRKTWAQFFGFQSGISAQASHASTPLVSLLSCMANYYQDRGQASPSQISSISDHLIVDGDKTWEQCSANSVCAHTEHSCHYGGNTCVSQHRSYAVDFGNEGAATSLKAAAASCNGNARYYREGTNFHISVGAESCGCDTGLPKVGSQ